MVSTSAVAPLTMRSVNGEYFMRLRDMQQAATYQLVSSVYTTNQASEEYPWLSESPMPIKWEGERSIRKLRSDKVTIVNADYETGLSFSKRDFIRDKTSQMQARVQEMAQNVALFPTQLLTDLMVTNGNAYDGVAFFSGSHSVGASGTIDNLITSGEVAGGATPTVAEQASNLMVAFARLLGFRNSVGQPMNEIAKQFAVMVPPALYGVTVAAINSQFTSNAASNPLGELRAVGISMVPVLNARLTAADEWYLFRTDAGIRPFIVQDEDMTPVQLGLDSEHCQKTNHVYFGHGWSGGVGYGRFELALKVDAA